MLSTHEQVIDILASGAFDKALRLKAINKQANRWFEQHPCNARAAGGVREQIARLAGIVQPGDADAEYDSDVDAGHTVLPADLLAVAEVALACVTGMGEMYVAGKADQSAFEGLAPQKLTAAPGRVRLPWLLGACEGPVRGVRLHGPRGKAFLPVAELQALLHLPKLESLRLERYVLGPVAEIGAEAGAVVVSYGPASSLSNLELCDCQVTTLVLNAAPVAAGAAAGAGAGAAAGTAAGANLEIVLRDCHSLTSVTVEGARVVAVRAPLLPRLLALRCSGTSMRHLPESALCGCNGLVSLELPAALLSIGEHALEDCRSLVELDLPTGVTHIRDDAFNGCVSLVDLALPSLVHIGKGAFQSSGLRQVVLPDTLVHLGNRAFSYCDGLESVDVSRAPLRRLSSRLFAQMPHMVGLPMLQVRLPDTLQVIGLEAFEWSALQQIEFPKGLRIIEPRAFLCSALTRLNSAGAWELQRLGNHACAGCPALQHVDLSGATALRSLECNAFGDCPSLQRVVLPVGLTHLHDFAFRGCGFRSLELPRGLMHIGASAFEGCSLESIALGPALVHMGASAFADCASLTSVDMRPAPLLAVPARAFAGCVALVDVELPYLATGIGVAAFLNCAIAAIRLPRALRDLGPSAFEGCHHLTRVDLPAQVQCVSTLAFHGCWSLAHASLPPGVLSIETLAFGGCTALIDVHLPNGLLTVDERAFQGCGVERLRVERGAALGFVGLGAFKGCLQLVEVNLSESALTTLPIQVFARCPKLQRVVLPPRLAVLGKAAFQGCHQLRDCALPPQLGAIGGYAFEGTALRSVALPGLDELGDRVFSGCTLLESADLRRCSSVRSVGKSLFHGCDALHTLDLPPERTAVTIRTLGVEGFTWIAHPHRRRYSRSHS
jgi:hypothetical protein